MAADYSFPFARVTISGDCFGGTERWSTGFQMGYGESGVESIDDLSAERVAVHWRAFFTNSLYHIPGGYRTLETKVAVINTNGTTNQDEISYHTLSPVAVGGSPDNPMPPQITVAATLKTEIQRGIGTRGRMFLPGYAHSVEVATGKIPSARTQELANGIKTFIDACNADVLLPGKVIVASKGHKTQQLDANGQPVYVGGVNVNVTSVRVGNVYDTQRRRRNELVENYTTATLA
jgi:hypothetical protein